MRLGELLKLRYLLRLNNAPQADIDAVTRLIRTKESGQVLSVVRRVTT